MQAGSTSQSDISPSGQRTPNRQLRTYCSTRGIKYDHSIIVTISGWIASFSVAGMFLLFNSGTSHSPITFPIKEAPLFLDWSRRRDKVNLENRSKIKFEF
jgi:hypothetical protein